MDNTSRDYPPGDLRVSDADRDRAVSALSAAFQAGRLSHEEFEERSAQALRARTGKELTALLADLPPERAPVARAPRRLERTHRRLVAARIAVGVSGVAAAALVAVALANGLGSSGSPATPAKRALAEEILAGRGIKVNIPAPVASGFDWVGTITPAVIAVLLVALIVITIRATRLAQAERA
jgi:hypothetical protein